MDVTDVIGYMGKSQIKVLIALLYRPLPGAFLFLSTQISLIELEHWCSPEYSHQNLTTPEWKECCVPKVSSTEYSRCDYYDMNGVDNSTKQIRTCSKWEYDRSLPYESIRADWDLVCNRGWYVSMLYLVFVFGNLVAYLPSGYIADRYGRKPICLIGGIFSAIVAFISAFSNSVGYLLALRFLIGIAYGAIQNPFICLFLECAGPEYRSWVILSFSGAWGLSVMIVSGIAYFISNWRILVFISSFPVHIPLVLILWWMVPESSRWMLSVRKYEQAEKSIIAQAKENGIIVVDPKSVMEELKKKVELDKEKQGNITFMDLLKDKDVRRTTLILYCTFILTVFVNHGYGIAIGRLGGSLHFNIFINGAVDIAALVLFFVLIKYASKRKALLLTFVLTGICFLLTIPVGEDLRWLRILLALIGRFCNTTSYNLLYVFASEVFPTSLRVAGVSGGMSSGRIGSIFASFADDMGRVYGRNAPMTLFGIMSLFTSAIFFLLPELTNRHLPDSLEETKIISSRKEEATTVPETKDT